MDATLRATSDLIALRTSAPVSPFGLIARARSDIDRLKTVLESYGYYRSNVTVQINGMGLNDPALGETLMALPKNKDARVAVAFNLGPLYHLRRVAVDGELPQSARGVLALEPGAPAVAANVLAAGARLLSALQDQGYAFAKVDPPVAYEDQTAPLLDVTFQVEAGPRVRIGDIHLEGLQRMREKLIRRRLTLRTGEQYSSGAIERARQDLLGLSVFASINVHVGTAVDGTGGVPITFQFRERSRHLVTINAAYSSDLGGSGGVTWSDRNVFGNAEQLNLSASLTNVGGSATTGLGYDATAKFILPDFGHRDQSLQFSLGAVKQFLQAYDQTAITSAVDPHAQTFEILDCERRREHRRRANPPESAVLLSNQRHRSAGDLCAARSHRSKSRDARLHPGRAADERELRFHQLDIAAGRSDPWHARFGERGSDAIAGSAERHVPRDARSRWPRISISSI